MTNDEAEKILMDMVNNDAIRENEKLKQALEACD